MRLVARCVFRLKQVSLERRPAMASVGFVEEAVKMARPRDQSAVQRAWDATRTKLELQVAAERLREERDEARARLASMSRDLEALFAASADSNADDEHDPEGQTIA